MRFGLGMITLLGLLFVCYLPLLPGGFVIDDQKLIHVDNPLATGALQPHNVWFQCDFPLSTFVLWLQWLAWGNNPAGYHVINLLLHGFSSILVWRLLRRLRVPGAWLAAAVFAIHPVCVNSVARIAEIKNTLSLPFFLLSFWLYLHHEACWLNSSQQQRHRQTAWWYAGALISFVLALLAKTSTVMLPVVLLACAGWQRGRLVRRDLLYATPFFVLSAGFGLMSAWFQKHQALTGYVLESPGFGQRLAQAGINLWFYLGKLLLPLNLNAVYPRWKMEPAAFSSYLPILLFGVVLAICWTFRRSWGRHVLFALGCFVVTLLPVLGFVDAQFLATFQVSDHLQYLPLIAPVALAVAGLAKFWKARTLGGLSVVFLIVFSVMTRQRARVFVSQESLCRDTLAKNPAAWAAANDLGCVMAEQKNLPEAAKFFSASLEFNPDNPDVHANLGQLLTIQGRFAAAETHFRTATKLKPDHFAAHKGFARLLQQMKRNREAMLHWRAILNLKPDADAHLALAGFLYESGEHGNAVAHSRSALALAPKRSELRSNLAWLLATCPDLVVRNGVEAVQQAEQACHQTNFNEPSMVGVLAAAYAEAGRFPDAVRTCEQTIQLAEQQGVPQFAAVNRQLLKLYRANKPYHESPPGMN